jgi:hypothetical protein
LPRYRIRHRPTGAFRELEAPFAQDACTLAGWMIGDCHVELIQEGPLTYPDRPERLVIHSQDLTNLQQRLAAARRYLGRAWVELYSPWALSDKGGKALVKHLQGVARTSGVKLPKGWADEALSVATDTAEEETE